MPELWGNAWHSVLFPMSHGEGSAEATSKCGSSGRIPCKPTAAPAVCAAHAATACAKSNHQLHTRSHGKRCFDKLLLKARLSWRPHSFARFPSSYRPLKSCSRSAAFSDLTEAKLG